MEAGLLCPSGLGRMRFMLCLCAALLSLAAGDASHSHATISVSAPHLHYTCPRGATVKLRCAQSGAALHTNDLLRHSWLFTAHSDQHCSGKEGPRHMAVGGRSHGNHSLPKGLRFAFSEKEFWLVLENLTAADQGRYCCMLLDIQLLNKHPSLVQKAHTHIILHITPERNGSQQCSVQDTAPSGGSAPVALAVVACILALFALPLILMLVYKQRENAQSSRRAQELVRMDSESQGHENPVFLGASPQIKTRTVSQIMARQSSETGRHLLSEPGTPLSPPAHGDVFFPIQDTIPESPDFLQV